MIHADSFLVFFLPDGLVHLSGLSTRTNGVPMKKQIPLLIAVPMLLAQQAFAALPEAVPTALTASQTDGLALVGLLAATGAAVFIIAKVLKRFGVFL